MTPTPYAEPAESQLMPPVCEVRQEYWPASKRRGRITAHQIACVRTTFCYAVAPHPKHDPDDLLRWLETNFGPRALFQQFGLTYWTEGSWETSLREDINHDTMEYDVFDSRSTDVSAKEDILHVLFLSRRDAAAFKLVFG